MVEILGPCFKIEMWIIYHNIHQGECTIHQFLVHFYVPEYFHHGKSYYLSLGIYCTSAPIFPPGWQLEGQSSIRNTCVLMNSTLFCIVFSCAGSATEDTFSTSGDFFRKSWALTSQTPNIDVWVLASLRGGGGGNSSVWHLFTLRNICCWITLLGITLGPHCLMVHTVDTHTW